MLVCVTFQAYFSKMPAKICNLRVDTLAIMLSQANVQAHARVRLSLPQCQSQNPKMPRHPTMIPEAGVIIAKRVAGYKQRRTGSYAVRGKACANQCHWRRCLYWRRVAVW